MTTERAPETMTAKDEAFEVLDALPDDASMDDVLYALDVRRAILRGEDEARRGEVISQREVEERGSRWRTSSGQKALPRTSTP